MTFDERMQQVGLVLPTPSTPGANYIQFVHAGELLFLTGQLCQWNGERRHIGKLGRELDVAAGQEAARLCALNLLAHLRVAVENSFERVVQCVRLTGYVNATEDFTQHSQVINGASDIFVQALGEAGRHTRIAVGTNGLPYGVAVEVEAIFLLRPR
jgi:enamine deaminase RidA (YjgF/YER057c/UK114 family)